jgi:carboxylesterase type B
LPVWTPYAAPQRATMVLNDTSQVVNDPTKERRQAMQEVLDL